MKTARNGRELLIQLLKEGFLSSKELPAFVDAIFWLGIKSLPLTIISSIAVAAVMSIQFDAGLSKFGGKIYVPRMVVVSILREMGPVFTAIMVAARAGAGFTAYLGSLVVTQQFDAYWALGMTPVKKILTPHFWAFILSLPILSLLSNFVAIITTWLTGIFFLQLPSTFVFGKILEALTPENFWSGFLKTPFLAMGLAWIACYFGVTQVKTSESIGQATTQTVVFSVLWILLGDFILTQFFLKIGIG